MPVITVTIPGYEQYPTNQHGNPLDGQIAYRLVERLAEMPALEITKLSQVKIFPLVSPRAISKSVFVHMYFLDTKLRTRAVMQTIAQKIAETVRAELKLLTKQHAGLRNAGVIFFCQRQDRKDGFYSLKPEE